METAQNETMRNTKSSSTVSYNNEIVTNELSKEKEEELLFGAEEDGDDEDALSDDSLRLRLSDDEDAEQDEHITTNCTDTPESKSQSRKTEQPPPIGVIAEEKSCLNSKQIVEKVIKSDSEELTQNEDKSAISVPENSTLSADENISENKITQNNVHNLEKSSIAIIPSEFNENSLNMCDKIKDDCHDKEIPKDKNIVEVEILNNDLKRENNKIKHISKSDKDLEISEVSNARTNAVSKQHALENDNLSTNNCIESSSYQNAELTIHSEDNLKETVSQYNEINSTNTCKPNNFDIVDNNNHFIDSVKVKIGNSETSSTTTTVSNNCVNNLTILNHKIGELQVVTSGTSLKRPLAEINHNQNSMDAIKSNRLEDNSTSQKDFSEYKSKKKNIEHEDMTQSINAKTQSMQQETSITLVQDQNDSSNIKDRAEIKTEDHDINKPINQVVNNNSTSTKDVLLAPINVEDTNNENKTKNTGTIIQKRKRLKKSAKLDISAVQDCVTEEDKQEEKECGRQKRRTARNAEEIIRKKYLNSDSDFSDSEEQFVTVSHKLKPNLRSVSPSTLKRHCPDSESLVLNGVVKKAKMSTKSDEKNAAGNITKLTFVEKFFQRDFRNKLQKFTQEELEELLIQKIVETITMRSEIGKLREQARVSEKNQEATRAKLQQLIKHVKDFEMILTRNALDRRTSSEKHVAPAKLYRSVGLQVSLMVEQGMQNLRQIQQSPHPKSSNVPNSINSSTPELNSNATSPRRGIKIRSPRRSEAPMAVSTSSASTISQNTIQTPPLISTVTPAALVVAKPLESQHTLNLPSQSSSVQQLLSAPQQQIQPPHQAIVLNGKIQNQINRSNATLIAPKPRNNDLIDLTDEEEKSKSNTKVATVPSNSILEQQLAGTSKPAQCFQRVIQTIPANVAITTQPASIRVVQPNQPTPTALVNNITQPRLAYVMQGGVGTTRQVIITSNANQIRPVTTSRPSLSTVTYKTGISTIANGTVRVLTTPAVSNVQISKHPAPLPDTPTYTMTPSWKLPPPAPSLKISKVSNGIVLSWNMNLSDKYADIASYQLYAYQEVAGVNPSTSLWKKVGDVRALPLPMACTLTQFSEGNNYYFAVRAVDTHSRKGQYSIPGNISL